MPHGPDPARVAREVRSQRSAERAVDDPRQLARAARIVRAALERRKLTLADIVPDDADDQLAS